MADYRTLSSLGQLSLLTFQLRLHLVLIQAHESHLMRRMCNINLQCGSHGNFYKFQL